MIQIPLEMEEQPATTPPCSYLRIVHPALRWTIHVRAGTYLHPEDTPPGRGGKAQQRRLDYVSLIDVLREICITLHKPLLRAEFELLHTTPGQRKRSILAFFQRCRYMHLHPCFGNQEENGMRRVDVLGARVSFIGLVPTRMYGKFRMILADRPRERVAFCARQVDLMMPLDDEHEAAGYNGLVPWGWKDLSTVWGLLEWYETVMPSCEQELRGPRGPRREYEVREESEEPVQGLGLELG